LSGVKSYICNIDPIHTGAFKLLGSIVTMAEPKKMITIAKQIGGNYSKYEFSDIIGRDTHFVHQIRMAQIAAKTNSRVLIMGESGTGKELFAQSIHSHSYRCNGPFVAISCAAIPRDLIESELFGYKGGAFTGARSKGMIGKFELANGGTLFLDEINGLPLQLQGKLLRVLQQNEIMRLGDNRTIPIDVRIIAASNTDLADAVGQGHFREDLYYRLNVMEIFIPPLRERISDLERLIDHILVHQSQKLGLPPPKMTAQALQHLKSYDFPGNVRELENLIERAMLLSQGKSIKKEHLLIRNRRAGVCAGLQTRTIKDQYKNSILSALENNHKNVSKAARELKIARSTLYRKMREFGIA
jgi:transcriptional regulator with PAS, ATPase and Fis domain